MSKINDSRWFLPSFEGGVLLREKRTYRGNKSRSQWLCQESFGVTAAPCSPCPEGPGGLARPPPFAVTVREVPRNGSGSRVEFALEAPTHGLSWRPEQVWTISPKTQGGFRFTVFPGRVPAATISTPRSWSQGRHFATGRGRVSN